MSWQGFTVEITPSRSDEWHVHKFLRTARLHMKNVSFTNSYTTDTKIASGLVPPLYTVYFPIMMNVSNTVALSFGIIDTSGNLFISCYTGGRLMYADIVYYTAS